MENQILGLHHITAIAGEARRNYEFYTKVLGLRLIKKTVNFDDPGTYHFYYGDKTGTPGTILTFFPWEGIPTGRRGAGMATEFSYAVPEGSFEFWINRFKDFNVTYNKPADSFGEQYLTFLDPDGLKIQLVIPVRKDEREPWTVAGIDQYAATRGFHGVTLTLNNIQKTADVLTGVFGYTMKEHHVNRYRYVNETVPVANIIDLVELPAEQRGYNAGGTIHHIAFRVKDDASELFFRKKVEAHGLHPTQVIDRNYFHSVYFREPGGVLFEIATENPGFTVDESPDTLGTALKLPVQYEPRREELEKILPAID